jgi:hypothetical protein
VSGNLSWRRFRERHVARDFGAHGRRLVDMSVLTAGREVIRYRIDHLWHRNGDRCRSILFVRDPPGLRTTYVRIHERGLHCEAMIELKLSTASRPITIAADRYRQQVLGTDFSYEDLRFWRPLPVECLSTAPTTDGAWRFEFKRSASGAILHEWLVGRHDGELLEYGRLTPAASRWSVGDWLDISPPSPEAIHLTRMGGRFESRMRLLLLDRSTCWPAELFDPETPPAMILERYEELLVPAAGATGGAFIVPPAVIRAPDSEAYTP